MILNNITFKHSKMSNQIINSFKEVLVLLKKLRIQIGKSITYKINKFLHKTVIKIKLNNKINK